MRWLLLTVMIAVAGVAATGQTSRPESPDGSEIASGSRTATVRFDAIVTDRRGRPILDLKAADFELRAGGVAQAIEGVELHHAGASTHGARGRTIALFLDEFHVTSGANTERARQTLLRFVDEQITASDRVIVMKPLDSQLAIQFAADRAAVRAAIDTFSGRAGDFTPRTPFEQQYLGHAPDAVQAARRQIVTAAIRALVTRLGDGAMGRSAVAVVSEGFTASAGRGERERRLPDFQSIVRAASRFNVAIYSLDPSEAQPPATGTNSMRTLTADTGGEAASGERLADALSHMTRDLDTYYVLTFQPSQRADGRFQRVELSTRRADAIVRARTGYWAPIPFSLTSRGDSAIPAPMRAIRRSPRIQTWYGLTRMTDGSMRLRITWEPVRAGAASQKPPASVLVRAVRRQGAGVFEGPIARVDAAATSGAAQIADFTVPVGRIEIDLAILAADGSTIDQETRDIDVLDGRALRATSLVPEVVRAGSAREFRQLSVDPQAAPTALRQFRRADRLLVRVPAISGDGSRMTVTARMQNRWGQSMRELPVLALSNDSVVQFDAPLAWLAAGEYEIAIVVRDRGADTMHRIPIKVTG